MTEELDALETLVTSPGWLLVMRYALEDHASQMETHLATAANETNDLMALQKIRQIIAARRAVETLLAWPTQRIAKLRADTQHATVPQGYARGGL